MTAHDDPTEDKPSDEELFLKTMRDKFALSHERGNNNRLEMYDDVKFSYGGRFQWDDKTYRDRLKDDRPALTINRVKTPIRQVSNAIRQNKPAIKVSPVDNGADKATAKIFNGLIRNIENTSMAQVAYQNAADGAIRCGFGVIEVRNQYNGDETFDQELSIKRVLNQFSVYFDPSAKEITREDAEYAFLTEQMTEDSFKAKYPKAQVTSFEGGDNTYDLWYGDEIRVARYYVKEPITKTLVQYDDGTVSYLTDEQIEVGITDGMGVKKKRQVKTHKVMCYIVSGDEVLKRPFEVPSKYIPLVPVLGEETILEGEVKLSGIVRDAKDPQRLYNYWRTTAAETIALQPRVPWLVTGKMIEGTANQWAVANKANLPYLIYKFDEQAGKPSREPPPAPPASMWQESAIASDDIKFTTGLFDSGLGNTGPEQSGKAILARQQKSDLGNALYADNLSIAIRHVGKILIDAIPRVYDTARTVRILNPDDSEEMAEINQVLDDGTKLNDLSKGRYDVTVSTGPSYQTRRQEAVETTLQFMQALPNQADSIADLVAKNLDTPEADEIARRIRKTLPPELIEGDLDDEEQEQAKEQAEASKPQIEYEEQVRQAQLDSIRTKTELDSAKAQETLAGIDEAERENLLKFLQATGGNTGVK